MHKGVIILTNQKIYEHTRHTFFLNINNDPTLRTNNKSKCSHLPVCPESILLTSPIGNSHLAPSCTRILAFAMQILACAVLTIFTA